MTIASNLWIPYLCFICTYWCKHYKLPVISLENSCAFTSNVHVYSFFLLISCSPVFIGLFASIALLHGVLLPAVLWFFYEFFEKYLLNFVKLYVQIWLLLWLIWYYSFFCFIFFVTINIQSIEIRKRVGAFSMALDTINKCLSEAICALSCGRLDSESRTAGLIHSGNEIFNAYKYYPEVRSALCYSCYLHYCFLSSLAVIASLCLLFQPDPWCMHVV